MPISTRTEQVTSRDGNQFPAHLAIPESGRGPGIVVIQEIFGVNGYIKGACERLANAGYVALAPDLYWRLEPGVAIDEKSADGLPRAFGFMGRLDFPQAADDAGAALEHLRRLPEVSGGQAGMLGFCLGGGIAYMVAAAGDPVTTVSYYGSGVPDALGLAGSVTCPILFHFGGADEYIPEEKQEAVRRAFAGRDNVEFHVHPGAGHAFDNHDAAMFHHPQAAARAWKQTREFLARTLPVSA